MKKKWRGLAAAMAVLLAFVWTGPAKADAAGGGQLPAVLLEKARELAGSYEAGFLVYDVDGDGSGELAALYRDSKDFVFCEAFGLDPNGNAMEIFNSGGELLAGSPGFTLEEVVFEGERRLAYHYHNFSGTAIDDLTIFVPASGGAIGTRTMRAEEDVAGDVGYSLYWQDGAEISAEAFHAVSDSAVVLMPDENGRGMDISQLTAEYGSRAAGAEAETAEASGLVTETGDWEVYLSDYNQIFFQQEAHKFVATIDLLELYGAVVGSYSEDSAGRILCQVEYKNFGKGYSDDDSTSFVLQRSGSRLDVPEQVWNLYPGNTVFTYAGSFTVEPDSGSGKLTGNGVRFRSGPGMDYFIMAGLDAGVPVTITGRVGDWYRVEYGTGELYSPITPGFVHSEYVEKDAPAAGAAQTKGAASGGDENIEKLTDYWNSSVGLDCHGVLGDVDRDGQADLIYVDETDIVRGHVLTVKDGEVRSIVVEQAAPVHADGYFNLFVRVNGDGTADLINYKDAMFQGFGTCAYTVFHLDGDGNRVETDTLSVSDNVSSPVSSEQLDQFNSSGGALIRGTTCLYTSGLEGILSFDGVVFPSETVSQVLEKALS